MMGELVLNKVEGELFIKLNGLFRLYSQYSSIPVFHYSIIAFRWHKQIAINKLVF